MPYARTCSECGGSLAGRSRSAKTCSDACRSERSRRKRRVHKEPELPPHQRAVVNVVRNEAPDIAHKVIQQEIAPVVREAMTEDVLRSIHQLVGLAPAAVQALNEDLASEDPVVRQRAYTLALKYTIGHPALIQPKDADPNQQLVVHFNLPRPTPIPTGDEDGVRITDAEVLEPTELDPRPCDECGELKTEFVGSSDRCTDCYTARRERVLAQFGDDA